MILLLVGVGVLASASSIESTRRTTRIVRDDYGGAYAPRTADAVEREYVTGPPPRGETAVEERRRYD